jgi:hypothetical protein
MQNDLQSWREACIPHRDIREDAVSEALFAVNLSRAIAHEGPEAYRDPKLFFARTHLTRTLQSLIRDVLNTLRGQPGANSVIHLQTNFGGGKTHAELALYHLLTSPDAALAVPRVADFLATCCPDLGSCHSGLNSRHSDLNSCHSERSEESRSFDCAQDDNSCIPQAAVAALPCADLDAGGREVAQGDAPPGSSLWIHTLWGELAYRLGGERLVALLRESDARRTAPGVVKLRQILTEAGPNVVLMDEVLHYVDKMAAVKVGDSNLATQTLAFIRELTEAVDAVPHSILVISLTMSRLEDLQVLTEDEAQFTLAKLEDILRRVEDARTPIEGTEIYDIVRARLFQEVDEEAAAEVAAAYSAFYQSDPWRDVLPVAAREAGYADLLCQAYPFHPSIIKVLYERWGSRPQFQLTRGTLRFLAHTLACLWKQGDLSGFMRTKFAQPDRSLIHLSDIPLADDDVRAEAVRVAGSAWEAVIGTDIAGADPALPALAQRVDRERGGLYTRYGLVQGVATSVFMVTHGGQQRRPTPPSEIRLAVARPGLPYSDLNQALDDCRARLYFYYEEEGGLIFKTEPNPNKVLADERANVTTDAARERVEDSVADVVGRGSLFNVVLYGFHDRRAIEPGDVPDDGTLQMVVLPPRFALQRLRLDGPTADVVREVAENYGNRYRYNRNMVCFLPPMADVIASAIDQAMHWLAARNVVGNDALMARFSEAQQQTIRRQITRAKNETENHIRRAYNTVLLPTGGASEADSSLTHTIFELRYVPVGKPVLQQAEEDLLEKRQIHRSFNPALLEGRWSSLWPKTATVITTEALWQKFARQTASPILTGPPVLRAMVERGVQEGVFAYGVLRDAEQDKLRADSYERRRVYLGAFDAEGMPGVDVDPRGVLMRPAQVDVLFPPVTPEEIAMLLANEPKQTVDTIFRQAREQDTVQGRVDKDGFFAAICAGVKAGAFGYATSAGSTVQRGPTATLTPEEVAFSGWLIGEDVPLPVTLQELMAFLPSEGRVAVQDVYQRALEAYGAERVPQRVLDLLGRCVEEGHFGYATSADGLIQRNARAVALTGYVGTPDRPPPDTRVIRLRGTVSPLELANVVKTVNTLSKLSPEAAITLTLALTLKGEVSNEHAVQMALREFRSRVEDVAVEDVKG